MEITESSLQRFQTWLVERGRGENTAMIYKSHLRGCAADTKGLTGRLLGKLAPKTKRTCVAALRAWAKFSKDADLTERLGDIRLPPARRVQNKVPLTPVAWGKLITHLRTAKLPKRDRLLRHVMVIIAVRGLRVGDTLHITRRELGQAASSGRLLFEGKGKKRSSYAAGSFLFELGELHSVPGDWTEMWELVSSSHKGAKERVWRRLKSEAQKVGIANAYPHQLRRTYATNFLNELAGDPRALIKLQKHMDWADLSTAASYADAVDADELDQVGDDMVTRVTRR